MILCIWTALRFVDNSQLNDVRTIICLRKFEVSVERISICNVIEKLADRGMHGLLCFYTDDVVDVLS